MATYSASAPPAAERTGSKPVPVTVSNFRRAETDLYFGRAAKSGGFGKLSHRRAIAAIDRQDVVRMNRDTIYSSGVFDLKASPLTIALPDAGTRFMSMQVVSQDHYTIEVVYRPGRHTYTRERVVTRYVFIIVRIFVDPEDPGDTAVANRLQDSITVEQANVGTFEAPNWDQPSQDRIRAALEVLGAAGVSGVKFGTREEVDPVAHLIATAIGWGGNPESAAVYQGAFPTENDGRTVYTLTVKDVPVDGFWSISVYNARGYFEKNDRGAYSLNNLTATPNPDGSFTVRFGGCNTDEVNCLPIMPGWNYTVRLYRPRQPILDGTWKFPEATPVK